MEGNSSLIIEAQSVSALVNNHSPRQPAAGSPTDYPEGDLSFQMGCGVDTVEWEEPEPSYGLGIRAGCSDQLYLASKAII